MTIQDKCCSVCGCKFNGAHPDWISDEEKLSRLKELIEGNHFSGKFLAAAKARFNQLKELQRFRGGVLTPLPERLKKSSTGKRRDTH